ncbi:SDR family NAD(P)-dependent oxidoreductase [Flavobacterium luteolum]|uniref:SDR family NAD(P)-dependent oxidoreductase n=1 Tax=Flavobacterium luteolum TaxID=3003259 RepID=UPI00248E18DE|nr:SDR family oxidoreductase [Flavobacterium luteolum]
MKLHNKTIVVTGAGNGMGRELVLQLLAKGAKVAALDINESALAETAKLAGERSGSLFAFEVDISSRKAVEATVSEVINFVGNVDAIINNAGIIQPFIKLNDLDYAAVEKVFNINFFGTLYVTKSFLPHLLVRPEAHIVNISSMGGFVPVPGQTIYGATKAAVKLMTEGLTQELKDTLVRVSVVFPGAVGTNIMHNSGAALPGTKAEPAQKNGINLPPGEAARQIIAGIENNQERIFVGRDSKMMNFMYRINARFASNLIGKQMKKILK